jgi:hypothetical protein
MMDGFLLGMIVTASFVAGGFFAKFWRATRDPLFLYFAAAFLLEGLNRMVFLGLDRPNEGNAYVYIVRLVSYVLILMAIINKNRS